MKKYKIILPMMLSILLSLFIAGCSNSNKTVETKGDDTKSVSETSGSGKTESGKETTNSNDKILMIDVKSMDKSTPFSFGMSKDNVVAKLKDLKLEVKNEIEITSSKDDPEYGNKQLWAEGISFSFDKNNQLYAINVNENIETSLGLKKGNSIEQIEKLYGKNYVKLTTAAGSAYEYTFGDHYFRVFTEADKVTEWVVSKYKLSK